MVEVVPISSGGAERTGLGFFSGGSGRAKSIRSSTRRHVLSQKAVLKLNQKKCLVTTGKLVE